jgi:hypothetical protein
MSRTFKLVRDKDVTGVSGVGVVVEGVVFSDGHAAVHWVNSPYPTTTPYPEGLESVMYIHDHKGAGTTRLVWDDEASPAGFDEQDISFLHDLLSLPDEVNHAAARRLLAKIRATMGQHSIPTQKSVP